MEQEVRAPARATRRKRRGDGLWLDTRTPGKPVWCIRYKGLDGKPHRERTDARTREEAMAILAHKTSALVKARIIGATRLEELTPKTFADFVAKEYLPHCEATHTESTYRADRSLAKILTAEFGRCVCRAINQGDVQRFVDARARRILRKRKPDGSIEAKAVKPATVNRELMWLSGVMAEAVRRGYADKNPCTGIPQLPENNRKVRYLSPEEEDRLLGFCPDYMRPLVIAALHTGMRQGELLALRWADIDKRQGLLTVDQAKNHKKRHIPINAVLDALLDSIPPFVGENGPSPYVFTNPETGTRYKDVGHRFGEVSRKAGFRDVSFHTLRHSFASRLVQAGRPLLEVSELLGHGDLKVTMRYAHLAPNNLRDAVNVLVKPPVCAEKRTRSVQKPAPIRPPAQVLGG